MSGRCGRCRLLRSARAVVLQAVLGDWRPDGPLTPAAVQEVFDQVGFHLFGALVEHQDLVAPDLAAAERENLWRAWLSRILAWLRFHGVTWTGGAWTEPTRRLPPALEWALIRHAEPLAWLASQEP